MRSMKNAGWSFQRSSRISTFSDPSFSRYVLSCQKQAEYTGGTVTFLGRLPADRDIMKTSQWDHIRDPDRKSTRLNSSHVAISYAVFCLKKERKYKTNRPRRHRPRRR